MAVKARKKSQQRKRKKERKPLPKKVREASSAALLGNSFHKLRLKSGVDPLFTNPFDILKEAEDYFNWVDTNPLFKAEWKDGKLVGIPMKRPYTLNGFCTKMGVLLAWWRGFKESKTYLSNKDFGTVMGLVEQRMYEQKFEGATGGFFNANLIARDLGLSEHTDVTSGGEKIAAPEFKVYNSAPPLAGDEKKVDKERKK